jgi:hypothetical protein
MSTIKISNLHPDGSDLFSDSESYMNELGDSQLDIIGGAFTTPVCAVAASLVVISISASLVFSPAQAAAPRGRGGGGGGGRARAL